MTTPALSSKLRTVRKSILWFQLSMVAGLGFILLSNWSIWLPLGVLAAGVAASVPLYLVVLGIWHLFKQTRHGGFIRFATSTAIVVLALASLPLFYLLWRAEAKPPTAPLVAMTDGQRTVMLQGMWHVGSEAFYKSVVYDLQQALNHGYVVFYEGVRGSGSEGDQWEQAYMGNALTRSYTALADVCGLKFQLDYFDMLEADRLRQPEKHVLADVTTLQLKQEFDRQLAADPALAKWASAKAQRQSQQAADARLAKMAEFLHTSTDGQRYLAGVVCRGIFSLQQTPTRTLGREVMRDPLEPVVVDFRNRALVEKIIQSPAEKIYVTYGIGHISGVIALLRRETRPWRVLSVKWVQVVTTPKEFDSALPLAVDAPPTPR